MKQWVKVFSMNCCATHEWYGLSIEDVLFVKR